MTKQRNTFELYTPEQIRDAEQVAMNDLGIPQELLMEHAALAVANAICEDTSRGECGDCAASAALLAGTGNNGADALATARLLSRRGFTVTVFEKNSDPGNEAYRRQRQWLSAYENVTFAKLELPIEWERYEYIVDGLFGIGCNRNLTGEVFEVVASLNAYTGETGSGVRRAKVFAIDVPSGIDSRTGQVLGDAVKADVTVTFSAKKTGLSLYPGRTYCGRCIVADVGIPKQAMPTEFGCAMRGPWSMRERIPYGHKGTFGKILILAGSENTPGAAVLAARAAFRSGAGMVKVVSTENVLAEMLHALPEAILCTREQWLDEPDEQAAGYDVIVAGPGIGTDEAARRLLHSALKRKGTIRVIDADALNILAAELRAEEPAERIRELQRLCDGECVLTPHPMELSRLTGMRPAEIAADRLAVAKEWQDAGEAVLVMKDAATMVVGDWYIWFNENGNDGMGTAGSGDVLAGMLGAIATDAVSGYRTLAQSAAEAVSLHGLAGDIAAEKLGTYSMTSGDIAEAIPEAISSANAQ
ncbi:MAG: NAD(P)H-hydrate dehydratase [Lachnospiraceae bacterium]|nr:NAD(P)H-hydrate dehydratase [Lachnospiraceae bacterium]